MVVPLVLLVTMSPSAQAAPGLAVDRQSASPGDSVTASATGFKGCLPDVPDDVEPGAEDVGPAPASVTFAWDDTHVSSQPVTGGAASATFLVPAEAALRAHSISATCDQDPDQTVTLPFDVVAPEPTLVPVPDLVGESLARARALLEGSKLVSGTVSGSGDTVQRQNPAAPEEVPFGTPVDMVLGTPPVVFVPVPKVIGLTVGEAALRLARSGLTLGSTSSHGDIVVAQSPEAFARTARGSAVDVTLGPVVPATVRVPDLIGSKVADAPRVLASRGLSLGLVTGHGDTVRRQRPRPGTLVPRRTSVVLGVEPGVRPSRLVPVPDVAGMDLRAAERALVHAGLRSGGATTGDHGTVVDTEPAAGVLVPRLTVVTLSVTGASASTTSASPTRGASGTATPTASITAQPTSSGTPVAGLTPRRDETSFPPLQLLAVVGAAVLLGGAATAYHVTRRQSHAGVPPDIRAVPAGMSIDLPRVQRREPDPTDKDVSIRIEPHPDDGTHLIEETRR
jgi:beta-lactam-binding protein with PASTA domain